ncbi:MULTISPECIES: hypothetical protein [unclassified Microbacterium]|uniref:hypothetical protein n=1 Tax=unclassified Microbacterium TaxID=2609290 RepID=UPI000EAA6C29|nr:MULTISPECIES: hypothetical protein [unclassified Microbacterium]MBT2484785.1 hypothetical protein [Microbacterium sp. ISL-108]RKN67661.1 hypothetical protein D7252_08740 [Microbacterium sp. CGR2]
MSTFEFDSTYSALTGENVGGVYIPTVEHSDTADILIDGVGLVDGPGPLGEWSALTGYTGQHGYRGAVMHPSETADDDTIREWVRDAGGDVFAIVEVREDDGSFPDGDPIGWAIIYCVADPHTDPAHPRCSFDCPAPMMVPA